MFSPPVFITIGDEYDKKDSIPDRFKGKSMLTSSTKRSTQDALFTKQVQSLSEGDKYVEPGYFEKRYRLENEKRKLTAEGFRYSSPSHKSTGPGDYFGTFSEKNPPKHEVEFVVAKPGEKGEAKANGTAKNILTNPGKRGTYGYPGLTLGEPIKYISDPYDGAKRQQGLTEKGGTRSAVGPPFKTACRKQDYFDETAHGVPKIYTLDKALPARRAAPEEKKPPLRTPFRPGGSLVASITKPPIYIEDPYELKEKAAREAKKNEKPLTAWKPLGPSKSLPVRPIKFTPV
jgi:hypothetical protein